MIRVNHSQLLAFRYGQYSGIGAQPDELRDHSGKAEARLAHRSYHFLRPQSAGF